MNDNYTQRFGIGFIIAMIFVLTMFQWTFPVKDAKPIIIGDLVGVIPESLVREPKIIEKEKKIQIRKVKLEMANMDLVDDIEFAEEKLDENAIAKGVDTVKLALGEASRQGKKIEKKIKKIEKRIKPDVIAEPVSVVEEMPRFGDCKTAGRGRLDDCSTRKLLRFIMNNIDYPETALENGIYGRVIAQFVIEKDGQVSQIEILRDVGGGLGQETIRVLSKMPKWKPGRQQGMPVRVRYVIPVVYQLD